MAQVGVKLEMDPEITGKLSSEKEKLWSAVHGDGSENRINGETVAEAASYSFFVGALVAGFQWIRKTFRNRGKTAADFAAEKEAARINRACGALEEMLLEYIRSAQEGTVDGELLDDLAGVLEEMHEYDRAGKLAVPGRRELAEIRQRIEAFTNALAAGKTVPSAAEAETPDADEFRLIRNQLIRQKALLAR